MRYVVFAVFVILPLVLWPSLWTFLAVVALGLPIAFQLMPDEKPRETDPALWHPDEQVRAQRLAAAMAEWKQHNSAWRW